ncbi:hypothetical protein [Streptomyces sp. NPDC057257]|uniref:hypothetical protein n=1 Tax=Streptomyces sp. NPDC057257 TaxID=3346071 RepID=UPI003644EF13
MESEEPPEDEVRPEEPELFELLEVSEVEELLDDEDDVSVLLLELDVLVPVSLLADAELSDCMVPISANIPAAAASVVAAVSAAMRRVPLRTAAAAPRSLVVMTVPLRSDVLSRTTFGERSERSL